MIALSTPAIRSVYVGMGEILVTDETNVELVCLGLGSCIGLCAYDAQRRLGAMAHIVLPASSGKTSHLVGKYADTAIPALLERMQQAGARVSRIKVACCGGASIFAGLTGTLDIGRRNIEAIHEEIHKAGLRIMRESVGGTESRTVSLGIDTGTVRLRSLRDGDITFTELGG